MTRPSRPLALLIDGNSLLHRAWHALPPMISSTGQMVNAVYGVSSILIKIFQSAEPQYFAVCWDTEEPTFRHTAAPEYKAQREEQPQELYDQIPLIQEIVEAMGGANVELPGFEADDLLGTFASRFAAKDIDVTVMTSDRDAFQMIGPRVRVMSFKKGVSETIIYDEARLLADTGLRPDQIADYKALRGDASDNLKGVAGIGEKTATELLLKFENLDGILKAAHDATSEMSVGVRRKLVDGEVDARRTLPLVQLVLDAPTKITEEQMKYRGKNIEKIQQLFLTLGFKTLASRLVSPVRATEQMTLSPRQKMKTVSSAQIETGMSLISTKEELEKFLDDARSARYLIIHTATFAQASLFAEQPELALGTETNCVAIAPALLKEKQARVTLSDALEDETRLKAGHGLKQVWHWCARHGFELNGFGFDTEIATHLLAAGEGGMDLASLMAARLGRTLPVDDGQLIAETRAIRDLIPLLSAELAEEKLTHILDRFELPLIPVLAKMESYGILLNRPYVASLTDDFRKEKARLEREMVELAGEEFNPASPSQLAHILFDVLKISSKGIKRGKTGLSTAAPELEKLEGAHEIIAKVGDYREVAKLLSTYVEALPLQADEHGRIHTTFNQALTATGRLSSSNPNLQNIPIRTELGRKIRKGFIAPDGYVLLSCDYSQIELRVIAALAKDAKMLEAFHAGVDIHTATAAAIWHVSLADVTPEQRRAAKAINFGIIYGQGPHGLAKSAGIPYDEARQFIDEYFQVYSGVRAYLDETKALAHARGYVETLFGRRRSIPDINSPMPQIRAAAERMAINMPVQGTATGDLIKLALITLDKELPKISAESRLLLQVHDEVVIEVPEKEVEKVAHAVKDLMENVEKIGCPIVVEGKVGRNWGDMKKVG